MFLVDVVSDVVPVVVSDVVPVEIVEPPEVVEPLEVVISVVVSDVPQTPSDEHT